ncbi:uncharacterized protein TNCV_4364171 [Trichonephila clavipes]|nr:uncharacterized protein TNCV_4364171 [Trichonephila clavipes]
MGLQDVMGPRINTRVSQAPSYGSRRHRAPSECATSVWMAADEAVCCTLAFITIWWSSRRLVYRVLPEPDLRVNGIFWIHRSKHLLTTQSERPN